MEHVIVRSSEIEEKVFGTIRVRELFNTSKVGDISVAVVRLSGTNRKVRNTLCNNFYFVLDGGGSFTINNEKHEIGKGDLVFIPKGTVYFDSGNMTMLAFSHPRFSSGQVEYLD